MKMQGWKTRLGGGLLILAGVAGLMATYLGYNGLALDASMGLIGGGFAAMGLGHKFDKIKAALERFTPPTTLLPIVLALGLLSGCAVGGPLGWTGATAEQLKALAADKNAAATCVRGVYAGALVTLVTVNADKGVPGTITIEDSCEVTFTTMPDRVVP